MNWKGYSMKKIPSDLTTDHMSVIISITSEDGVIGKVVLPVNELLDNNFLQIPLGAYIGELLSSNEDMYTPWNEVFEAHEEGDIYYGGLQ